MLPIAALAARPVGRWLSGGRSSSSAPGVGGLAVAIRLAAAGHRVVVLERNDVVGGKLAARRHDGFSVRRRPVAADPAARLRRAVPRGRDDAGRRGRPRPPRPAVPLPLARRWPRSSCPTTATPRRTPSSSSRPAPARRGGASTSTAGGSGRSARGRSSPARWRARGSCCGGCARRRISSPSIRCARCTAAPRRTSPIPASCSGPGATRPTPARRRTGRRPRWRASRTSSRASGAGTRAAGSTPCGRRCSGVAVARRRRGPRRARGRADRHRRRCRHRRRARPTARRSPTGVVVANADAEHVYGDLLPDGRALRRVRRADRSTSGLVARRRRARADAGDRPPQRVVRRRRPRRVRRPRGRADGRTTRRSTPASRPSPTRPRRRAGAENWFLLVNTPAGASTSTPIDSGSCVLDRLAARGVDLRDRVVVVGHDHPRPTSRRATARRAGRSTARRRTVGGPRSCGPATVAPSAGCTSSAAPATPAAGCRSWRRAPASSPMIAADGVVVVRPLTVGPVAGRGGGRALASPVPPRRRPAVVAAGRATPGRGSASSSRPGTRRRRIGPLLDAVVGAPGVAEVIVVDDESERRHGRRGPPGGRHRGRRAPAAGRLGRQGVGAAAGARRRRSGEWVVLLDADTRPSPALPAALVARAVADGLDLLTVAGRFECPTAPLRWLHPALLTTLVYRGAPPGAAHPGPVHRRMGNGQCMAARRRTLVDAGGLRRRSPTTPSRTSPSCGRWRRPGSPSGSSTPPTLLTVRMYETARRGVARAGAGRCRCPASIRCRDGWASWRSSPWPRRCRSSASWRAGPTCSTSSSSPARLGTLVGTARGVPTAGRRLLAVADGRRRRRRRPGPRHRHPPPGLARPHVSPDRRR